MVKQRVCPCKKTLNKGWRKPTHLTSATSVSTSEKAVSVVPSGSIKTDVHRENTDVRWVGFHPLLNEFLHYLKKTRKRDKRSSLFVISTKEVV